MRILITGGCGFLGSNLAADALNHGDEVTILDSLERQGAESNRDWLRKQGELDIRVGDVRDPNVVEDAVSSVRPEAVFHVAGQVAMTTSLANPRYDFEVNALGTFNVLDAVRRHAPEAIIAFSSTNKVYGDLEQFHYTEDTTRWTCVEHPEGFNESIPLAFHSPYGCSKGCADQYLLDFHRMYGLRTMVFRHSSMYGGRQFATADQGWIGWFCSQAHLQSRSQPGAPFTISGSGKQVRDVLHAEDMCRLYRAALSAPSEAHGQAFNIGGGIANSLSLLELFAHLERIFEVELRYEKLPPRASDQLVFVADVAKARDLLGWEPEIGVADGLNRMAEWTRTLTAT